MRIGIPRESKPGERRLALDAAGAAALAAEGHEVRVAAGAGAGIGIADADFAAAGAAIVPPDEATIYGVRGARTRLSARGWPQSAA